MSDATVASAKTANKVLASGERNCGAMAEHKGAVRSKAEPWNEQWSPRSGERSYLPVPPTT